MRVRIVVALLFVFVFAYGASALAQNQNPLVGSWERLSVKNDEGVDVQPPEPAAFVIFSADGYFSQTVIPTGRNKLKKPLEDMTKEELLNRFQLLFAWRLGRARTRCPATRLRAASSRIRIPISKGPNLCKNFASTGTC